MQRYFQFVDKCCEKGTCTNPGCQEYPDCRRCKRMVEDNPWMLNSVQAQGDNNRPFGG